MQVGRIFHRHHQPPILHAKRKHPVPPQELLVHQTGHVWVHIIHAQLYEVQSQPSSQGFSEVGLSHIAQREEGPANPLALLPPEPVRLLELPCGDHPLRHQDLPDPPRRPTNR